jgi:Mn-containing catalase
LRAEKQLTKALPKMAQVARFDQAARMLLGAFHRNGRQIERLNKCFALLGETARADP